MEIQTHDKDQFYIGIKNDIKHINYNITSKKEIVFLEILEVLMKLTNKIETLDKTINLLKDPHCKYE